MMMERLVFKNSGKVKINFVNEFRDAIHGMKLGLTEDEITDIIKHIGHNGCVSKKEFNKALNL